MLLKTFASAVLLLALVGCKQDVRFVLDRMPSHYRQCAEKVVAIPGGPLTYSDLLGLLAKLRKSELKQNRCLKGAIAWSDAQVNAFNRYYGK